MALHLVSGHERDSRSDCIERRDSDEDTSSHFRKNSDHLSCRFKLGIGAASVVTAGEIRQNLDCLKASVLSYYSRLYTDSGQSIEERLDRLSGDYSRSFVSGVRAPASHKCNVSPQRAMVDPPPPDAASEFASRNIRGMVYEGSGHIEGMRNRAVPEPPGTSASGGARRRPDVVSFHSKGPHEGLLNEMMSELRKKCLLATKRLNSLGDYLEREVEDPALREWEFSTYPQIRRRPSLGGNRDLRDHLLALFQHLSNQSHINQMKIRAMRSKLKVLNLHTKANMIQMKSDPRIAF